MADQLRIPLPTPGLTDPAGVPLSFPPPAGEVRGPAALAEFRRHLTGTRFLDLFHEAGGRLLVQLPVGVGKSFWVAAAARELLAAEAPGTLVLVLAPRTEILREISARLDDLGPVVLGGRPRRRCGDHDAEWTELKRAGCAALARETLCARCPHRRRCGWPRRHARLGRARLVLAAQQQAKANPGFVRLIQGLTGATRVVTLVDEIDLVLEPFTRAVAAADLARLAAVLADPDAGLDAEFPENRAWADRVARLAGAGEDELRGSEWGVPRPDPTWAVAVQRLGRARFGNDFRFAAHDVGLVAGTAPDRRGCEGGAVTLTSVPDLGDAFAVFAGAVPTGLVEHRLNPDGLNPPLSAPFDGVRFADPGTVWVNLNNRSGAARYFRGKNADGLLAFFARLIAGNIGRGRRTLLVARKKLVGICTHRLKAELGKLGVGHVEIVTGGWARHDLSDPRTLPLVTYGMRGVNRFEDFESVVCLSSFYVAEEAVTGLVNDLRPADGRVTVELGFEGTPARRTVSVTGPGAGAEADRLARWALDQLEADVVLQAVGRIRPFTRPREVFTFHAGAIPGVTYDREFATLKEAREYFGLATARREKRDALATRAVEPRDAGLTREEIAAAIGRKIDAVNNYLRGMPRG